MTESIEIVPVAVLTRVFPARPSSVPEIRDFLRRCLSDAPLSEADNRELGRMIFRALLDGAGPAGRIQISCRVCPDTVEFDVLHSVTEQFHPVGRQPDGPPGRLAPTITPAAAASFAEWIAGVLRREGMTKEAAARQLGVSVKTVSRWVGGETEPRLRELRRIQELFGDVQLR